MQSDRKTDVVAQCRDQVFEAAPEIIQALIAEAKRGSCPHAKFLFDFAEAIPPREKKDKDEERHGPSLAEVLLERLDLMEPLDAAGPSEAEAHM